ncbi:MAG: hypothetical protein HPY64_05565 [Anaerolineae bacterium]|nr:hypothetical protein [Anaerolineae bacterium]
MTQEQLIGLLIGLWGAYALWAGLFGWRRALRGRLIRGLVRLIGPVGTRIVYVIVGLALLAGGILFMGVGTV